MSVISINIDGNAISIPGYTCVLVESDTDKNDVSFFIENTETKIREICLNKDYDISIIIKAKKRLKN